VTEKLKKYRVTTAETRIYHYDVEVNSDLVYNEHSYDEAELYGELDDDKVFDYEIESTDIIRVREIENDKA
jgi:hypothetical protein